MTQERYDELLREQAGLCAVCGKPPKHYALAADHCHKTGKLGKLLCTRCNVAIGVLEHAMRPLWDAYLLENR